MIPHGTFCELIKFLLLSKLWPWPDACPICFYLNWSLDRLRLNKTVDHQFFFDLEKIQTTILDASSWLNQTTHHLDSYSIESTNNDKFNFCCCFPVCKCKGGWVPLINNARKAQSWQQVVLWMSGFAWEGIYFTNQNCDVLEGFSIASSILSYNSGPQFWAHLRTPVPTIMRHKCMFLW